MSKRMKKMLVALMSAVFAASGLPALADSPYPIVFPVAGENTYSDTFGDPRGAGRTHEGVDIMADKMTPVVAAASGTVGWMHDELGGDCCAMELVHDDGYKSVYIHLNNDTPGTDDGLGWGFAPGITTGTHVTAGQVIGYVGDSGNAEWTSPHLHFELRDPDGVAFDPYPSLLAAPTVNPLAADEMFFYRDDGLFRYYDIGPDGWDSIAAVDLDGDGQDEMFFYRDDGLFRYYDVNSDGTLGSPLVAGDGYTTGWSSITAVDLDGDGQDEMFFYRDDGLFRYYNVQSDGSLPQPLLAGDGYTTGWSSIVAVDLDGDGADEMFFYRDDGLFRYYQIAGNGVIGSPILEGDDYTSGWSSIASLNLDYSG